jgi:hypothetical protein
VLIAVLGLIALLSVLMISFMGEAVERIKYNGLMDRGTDLRERAYSGLEVALASISQLAEIDDGLRCLSQGWGRPLEYAAFTPFDDCELSVVCEDESAKLPLAALNEQELAALLEELNLPGADAEKLSTALLDWMDPDDKARLNGADGADYERALTPCVPSNAVPRSWEELKLVEGFRGWFLDADGAPTALFLEFQRCVSLLNPSKVNINDAPEPVLRMLGELDRFDDDKLLRTMDGNDGLRGTVDDEILNSVDQLSAGGEVRLAAFDAQLLRLRVVVTRGDAHFSLDVLLQLRAHSTVSNSASGTKTRLNNAYKDFPRNPSAALSYPFTILQIIENRRAD